MEWFWTSGIAVGLVANLALAWFLLAMAKEVGLILARLGPDRPMVTREGPSVGTKLEPELVYESGYVDAFEAGRSTLWLFLSPTCSVCETLQEAMPAFLAHYGRLVRLMVVYDRVHPTPVYLQSATVLSSPMLHTRFRLEGTPYAVVVDKEGTVSAKGVVNTLSQIENLLELEVFAVRAALRRRKAEA